jgi:hypothetical protein
MSIPRKLWHPPSTLRGYHCRNRAAHFSADDRAAETRDLLAQRIIEIAQRGERDRRRIVDEALAQFVS